MQIDEWQALLGRVVVGKRVGGAIYIHTSAVPDELSLVLGDVRRVVGCSPTNFNVVKLFADVPKVSLLHYPSFFDEAFPLLTKSWTVDLVSLGVDHRTYDATANPPVLHRKELLLAPEHPERAPFVALTEEAERAGLFVDPAIIGHKLQWDEELRARGYCTHGNQLILLRDVEPEAEFTPSPIPRHRTALSRRALSTPMQALWRHGFLDGRYSVFDYGCGRGDDASTLLTKGLQVGCWDPYFRPEGVRGEADVVNLGFVLNVIEDPRERVHALRSAYALTRVVLAVAVLIGGRTAYEKYRILDDGVLTSIGTFQKYFSQSELIEYVRKTLGRDPVTVAPGLCFVFRSDFAEQDYFEARQRSRLGLLAHEPLPPPREPTRRPSRQPREARGPRASKQKPPSALEQHAELANQFWQSCLEFARVPSSSEFPRLAELEEKVGKPARVIKALVDREGGTALEEARRRRRDDIAVFLALNVFEKRKSFGVLSELLQTDIRELWGSYPRALEQAHSLLFSLREPSVVGPTHAKRFHALDLACLLRAMRFISTLDWSTRCPLLYECTLDVLSDCTVKRRMLMRLRCI